MNAGRPRAPEPRAIDWLLRLYPAGYRARFEAAMRASLLEELARARKRSALAQAAFWTTAVADAISAACIRRHAHSAKGISMLSLFSIDWREAFRSLRASPVVTVVAVLSLALGIGANTALFSILNGLMLKSLPVKDPASLVMIDQGSWTNPIWEQIKAHRRELFESAFAWSDTRFDLSSGGATDYVDGMWASGETFDVLGVHALLGRTFTDADDARNGGPDGPVAVVSYGLWQRRFGGANDVLGKHLTVSGLPVTIVGVLPPSFFGLDVGRTADIALPINVRALILGGTRALDGRSVWWVEIMGRLKAGETLAQAQAALQGLQPGIRAATMPENSGPKEQADYLPPSEPLRLISAASGESQLRATYGTPLEVIMTIVAIVLLIACANIANLLLARATARQREMSIRLALGASRLQLARQLMAESLLLSLAGAVLGLIFSEWGSALLLRQIGASTVLDVALDGRVLLFTAGVGVATAVIFGLAPALGIGRLRPNDTLKTEGRAIAGDARSKIRHGLVIAQVALSLGLIIGAALFLRTLSALTSAPAGFDPRPLLTVNVLAPPSIKPENRLAFFDRVRDSVAALPGVSSARVSSLFPLGGSGWNTVVESRPGEPALPDRARLSDVNVVEPGWFATYSMRLLAGRDFDPRDGHDSPRVMVVNESFARRFFPGESPIGSQVRASVEGRDVRTYTVVGVVNDALYRSVRKGFGAGLYLPMSQLESIAQGTILTVRAASGDPSVLTSSVSKAIALTDPRVSFTIQSLADRLKASLQQERLVAMLGGFFGGLALLLAGLGLYGVTAYSVSRRRAEIGVRMTLGATAPGVVRLVMKRVLRVLAVGIVFGGALSWWASGYVASLLFGIGPRDPMLFGTAAAILLATGLMAGWLPARRASRIDPARALRES